MNGLEIGADLGMIFYSTSRLNKNLKLRPEPPPPF